MPVYIAGVVPEISWYGLLLLYCYAISIPCSRLNCKWPFPEIDSFVIDKIGNLLVGIVKI